MNRLKIFYFLLGLLVFAGNADCQNRLDSIELKLKDIKYVFGNNNTTTGKAPPGALYVHCMISCKERQSLENISGEEWITLMRRNSELGLIITALLYDLFKEGAGVFMNTESKDVRQWKNVYWKTEINSWRRYLKSNRYKFSNSDCFDE